MHEEDATDGKGLERDFVFVGLLELLTSEDLVDDTLLALDDNVGSLLHCLLFLSGDLPVGLTEFFDIFTGLVSLEKVFERSAVKMVATGGRQNHVGKNKV